MVRILPRIRASARENIVRSEVIDFPELGMEAVRAIDVVDFPAFIIVDNKGNDLYAHI
jgi:fumarate hydratase class I